MNVCAVNGRPCPKIKLLLADRQALVLKGLELIVALEPDFELLASCSDDHQIPHAVQAHKPDVLLLDLGISGALGMNALEIVRFLREEGLDVRIVLLVSELTDEIALEAIRLGVNGFFPKDQPPELLYRCVRQVHAGEQWLERRIASQLLGRVARQSLGAAESVGGAEALTPRERELARQVATGISNGVIARQLKITEGTVKVHLHRIYVKLNLKNRVELANHAREHGLI